jgi:hypothetical protein
MTKETNYKMNHDRRGIALVINIRNYDAPNPFELEERVWSEKDVENLKKTLEYLEFDFRLCENLKANEISVEIERVAQLDHSKSDCFLCVVMSHGNGDKIVTSDNKEISFKAIMTPIKLSKSLENKPKMFFFQACRGAKKMARRDSDVSMSSSLCENDKHTPNFNTDDASHSSNENKKTLINAESDLLVYYATLENHYAYGNVTDGTYFIQGVCDVLFNEAYKNLPNNLPLSQMIMRINEKVKEKGVQLAESRSVLTKEIYFTPKLVSLKYSFGVSRAQFILLFYWLTMDISARELENHVNPAFFTR